MLDVPTRASKTAGPTVLLIDDDPIALEELGEILELAHHRPLCAGNTEEAFLMLNARPDISVVVTDVHIREDDGRMVNGVDFVTEARRQFDERDMRFIVISGDAGAAADSVGAGAMDFLTKPLMADDLISAIGEASAAPEESAASNDFLMRKLTEKVTALQRAQTDLAAQQDEARTLRETDVETGLINAAQLAREIDAAPGGQGALIRFDLGGLNEARDALEPFIAVALLLDYAGRIQDMVRRDDLVARLGRQELGLYIKNEVSSDELSAIATRAMRRITRSRVAEDLKVMIRPTVGVARRKDHGGEQLIAEAGFALRRALSDRPGVIVFYDQEQRAEVDRNMARAAKLREAIEKGHIQPWFQPQIEIATGKIIGWEALARWRDPEEGIVSPGEFLPLAEDVGLLPDLDLSIQHQALTAMRELERLGLAGHRISINVTAAQLKDSAFLDALRIELERVGFGFERVAIEILESTMLDEAAAAPIRNGIERLKGLGASIELDDFGTGHAGLSSLRDLPVARVKIDRSFVDQVDRKPELQTFTRALIGLAKALGVEVLAEGVERAEEVEWLRREGCDAVQGYLTGKPMPLEDIQAWSMARAAC